MTLRKGIVPLILSLSVTLFSCDKDPSTPDVPPTIGEKLIEVAFSENGVSIDKVDSVFAVFKLPGSVNVFAIKKMVKSGNKYVTFAQELSPSTYEVEFTVYTKKQQPGIAYSYIYKLKTNIALPLQTSNITQGPSGNYSGTWAPYFMFYDPTKNVTLIIAERVDDPYFEVRAPQLAGYKLSALNRETYGGGNTATYLVESESWVSPNNPYLNGTYINNTAFAQFAEKMKNKEWYRAEFSFYLDEGTNTSVHFDHIYYKRP
jgi:hypothetical protein